MLRWLNDVCFVAHQIINIFCQNRNNKGVRDLEGIEQISDKVWRKFVPLAHSGPEKVAISAELIRNLQVFVHGVLEKAITRGVNAIQASGRKLMDVADLGPQFQQCHNFGDLAHQLDNVAWNLVV